MPRQNRIQYKERPEKIITNKVVDVYKRQAGNHTTRSSSGNKPTRETNETRKRGLPGDDADDY